MNCTIIRERYKTVRAPQWLEVNSALNFNVWSLLEDLLSSHHIFLLCVGVQEQTLGGPRIKHVCRAAAVALGQPRAMVPDDIPRLSALPLHEREGITFSPTAEGTEGIYMCCF